MPTTATIIAQAAIGQYLAVAEYNRRLLFQGGSNNPIKRLARLIYITRKAVDFIYQKNNSDPTLIPTGNYLYWLVGKYNSLAANIISGGGSGEIINPSTGTASTVQAYYDQFVIGEPDAPMAAGETILIIPIQGMIENSVDVALDGVDLPLNRNDRISFTIDYSNPAQVSITFNQGVSDGQLYEIRGLRLQTVATPSVSETFFIVNTYADMVAASTGPYFKKFLVLNDEVKNANNVEYNYWPNTLIDWNITVDEIVL